MKLFRIVVLVGLCLVFCDAFTQKVSQKFIEADLLKAFKKINYWHQKHSIDTTMLWADSLETANKLFGKKLVYYTSKYPKTITQSFNNIGDEQLNIINSKDNLIRIYGWNTEMGGTEIDFENVIQYKIRNRTKSVFQKDTVTTSDSGYVYQYDHIDILKTKGKTYYLATYHGIFGTWALSRGIQIFCIKNGQLNKDVKLIKTKTGLHSQLYYNSDYYSYADWKVKPKIIFNPSSKTIKIPITTEMDKMTHNYITYKFTGQYFEKVK